MKRRPDGHCLYHALLGNDDMEAMWVLRAKIASWLEASQKEVFGAMLMQNWILASAERSDLSSTGNQGEIDAVVQRYLQGVKSSICGGATEIFAFSQVNETAVAVYQGATAGYALIHTTPGRADMSPRRLLYVNRCHYDELRPRCNRTEAVEEVDCRDSPQKNTSQARQVQDGQDPFSLCTASLDSEARGSRKKRSRIGEHEQADSELPLQKKQRREELWNQGLSPVKAAKTAPEESNTPPAKEERRSQSRRRTKRESADPQRLMSKEESSRRAMEHAQLAVMDLIKQQLISGAGHQQRSEEELQRHNQMQTQQRQELASREEDIRLSILDIWRNAVVRLKTAEEEGRQWLKLADTKRKIRQRIGFTKQEGEARADISDQWRKEWM